MASSMLAPNVNQIGVRDKMIIIIATCRQSRPHAENLRNRRSRRFRGIETDEDGIVLLAALVDRADWPPAEWCQPISPTVFLAPSSWL